jgi:uncharacterized SAM-binding protein YcdF (DUF218 family)
MTYLQPGILLIALILLAAARVRNRRAVVAAVVLLLLWSLEPVSMVLYWTLERPYPIQQAPLGEAEAIVVLAGGAHRQDPTRPEATPLEDTYIRAAYAAWLYRNWKPLPVVASGGVIGGRQKAVLAEVMRRVLEEKGVPPGMIWMEGRSRSTYENALYSAELLRGRGIRRIALVTEAYHMRRAEGSFRRQGMEVVPAPCAYRHILFSLRPAELVPSPKSMNRNELALHEWVGLFWYRVSGKI